MKNLLRFFRLSFIQELKKTLAYPISFWLVVFTIPLYSLIQIVFLESIYSQTSNFVGYSKYEAYVLFGTFAIVQNLGYFAFKNRLSDLKNLINGWSLESLDLALVKPVDSQIFATLGKYNFGTISPFIIGVIIVWYGLSHQPHLLSIFSITSYLFLMVMGMLIFYLTLLFFSTFLFWYPDLQMTENLWESTQDIGQYPSGLYHGTIGIILNFIIPLTLMAGIPVDFLFRKTPYYMFFVYLIVVIILFLLTRLFWKSAIKKYSSSSS